jgi:hypothetical protein
MAPASGAAHEAERRFLDAATRQKAVAAFVDYERRLGLANVDGGRVAALVKQFGHGMPMLQAHQRARLVAIGNRYDLMQKELANATTRRQPGRRSGPRAVAGRAEDIQRDF